MREQMTSLRREFDETARLARSVLAGSGVLEDTRLESAARRVAVPHLTILLVGGTQVGKSTLLNALARERLSEVGQGAATTQHAVFYAPADVHEDDLPFVKAGDLRVVHRGGGLAGKVIVDAPDCDSFLAANKRRSLDLLTAADVVLVVTSWEKYNQLSLHAVLQPEIRARSQASFVFAVNKMDELSLEEQQQVVADFGTVLGRLGIASPTIFPISALVAFEERTGAGAPTGSPWELAPLETFLWERLDLKIKGSNLASAMARGLEQLVDGGPGGATIEALVRFVEAVDSAEIEFQASVGGVVCEVLDHHRGSFLTTLRGIAGERIPGGFGVYLSALTFLRPSRLGSILAPGRKSAEGALIDTVSDSLARRLARCLLDSLLAYFRRLRVAAKELRERVGLSEEVRALLDTVGTEPMLAAEALGERIRPGLEPLGRLDVGRVLGWLFNLPCLVALHAAPMILVYHWVTAVDPAKIVMWLVTLPFVLLSILELQRFVYETFWLRRVVSRRIREISTTLEQSVMEAVGVGALAAPRRAHHAIRSLLDRLESLDRKIRTLATPG